MERKYYNTDLIDNFMKKHNFTKKELCEFVGITQYSLNQMYKQKIINPDYTVKIIRKLNFTCEDFLYFKILRCNA